MQAAFANLAAATYKNWLSPVVMTCSATEFPALAIQTVIVGIGGYAQQCYSRSGTAKYRE